MSAPNDFPSLAAIAAGLASRPREIAADAVDAAVMALLRPVGAGAEILLARRAERPGDPWSGHVGLPGGRVDPGDRDALAVAVRETVEEVGVHPLEQGRLLGGVGILRTRLLQVDVAVFAAELDAGAAPAPVDGEIASVRWVALDRLRHAEVAVPELPTPVPAFLAPTDEGDWVVWGMTYRMLQMLGIPGGSDAA